MNMEVLKYHALALLAGYVLDLIIGDPHYLPHPIRLIGKWISIIENKIYRDKKSYGLLLVISVLIPVILFTSFICYIAYKISPITGTVIESILSFYCLATRSLFVESKAVMDSMQKDGIEVARKSLSMIVGRDTDKLSEKEIIKATVETVAENTSDGIVAPLIYLCLGGPVLGLTYKACNTMDSMVGYKNDRYNNFGFCAARLDDFMNFIPSRICAILIIIVSFFLPGFSGRNSMKIWLRDRRNHKSPNSAQSESAYAGALGLKLAGGAFYFGKWVEKPYIGDEINIISREDVKRSHILLYGTSILCETLCMVAIFILMK